MDIFRVDRESDTPLYIQLRENITDAIAAGKLKPGSKLPSVCALSKEVGVTQATVRRAIQDLGNAGHTECHVGRGTFIRDAAMRDDDRGVLPESMDDKQSPKATSKTKTPLVFATRRLRSGVRKALFDIMPLAHKPEIIQLTHGVPDGEMLPADFMETVTQETLADGGKKFIQATDTLGMYELREEIASRFNLDGANIAPDQILITNGSLQAASLVAQAAMETGDGIICETPCFQGIPDTFAVMGHWVDTVQRDQQGPIMEKLDRASKGRSSLFYLCPYAHNPMGTDLSVERYDQLVDWARQTGSVVVADEIFKDLRYKGKQQPSLLGALGSDQTIVISSLSKTVMTGLRLGWIISSQRRIRELARLKRLMDQSTPALIQGMALTIFRSGKFDAHTEKMKKVYGRRMDTLLKALSNLMPEGVSWTTPTGGFSILVELPRGYSSVALLLSAIDKGVSFLPGPLFDIDQRYVHALRLSTAWVEAHQIKEGVELLASAIETLINKPPGDSGLSGLGNFQ